MQSEGYSILYLTFIKLNIYKNFYSTKTSISTATLYMVLFISTKLCKKDCLVKQVFMKCMTAGPVGIKLCNN